MAMQSILIIDDTPFWRDMTAETLRRNEYEVQTASDGLDGLRLLNQCCPDLLIPSVLGSIPLPSPLSASKLLRATKAESPTLSVCATIWARFSFGAILAANIVKS
jgi:CheY-like chemotaxis protein